MTQSIQIEKFQIKKIQNNDTPRATDKMEQPKSETEQAMRAPGQDPDLKHDPKGAGHATNGDGKWTSLVIG